MRRRTTARGAQHRDGGLVALEVAAATPLVVLVGVLTLQVGVIFAAITGVDGAARAAARAASQDLSPTAAAEASLPGWLERSMRVSDLGGGSVEVSAMAPSFVPVVPDVQVRRTVHMPEER